MYVCMYVYPLLVRQVSRGGGDNYWNTRFTPRGWGTEEDIERQKALKENFWMSEV